MYDKRLDLVVDCLLAKGLDSRRDALNRLREYVESEEPPEVKNIDQRIRTILHNLGMPSNLKGYKYSVVAIRLSLEHPEYLQSFTHKLYPKVAELTDSDANNVERSIRHAIEVAFERGDPGCILEVFGSSVSADRGKPKNCEFISAVTEHIRMEAM